MKFYKFLLRFIQIFVVLVVLPRVASFVGLLGNNQTGLDFHDLIRFAFAATLGLGTISTAYFSDETEPPDYDEEPANPRERRRREREAVYYASMINAAPYARRAMFLFAFLDGSFNLADAMFGASSTGLLDPALHGPLIYVYGTATFLFGVAPTILAIVLAKVISMVDRIPEDYERPASRKEMDVLRTIMGNLGLREYRAGEAAELYHARPALPEPMNGGQAARIRDYLERHYREGQVPTIPEIQHGLGAPVPSKSTVSVARAQWLHEKLTLPQGGND